MVRVSGPAQWYSSLNESPSEKEGKCLVDSVSEMQTVTASMKVPPKRKGNLAAVTATLEGRRLNESPSEKEGKYASARREDVGSVTPQ